MSVTLLPYSVSLKAWAYYTCNQCGLVEKGGVFRADLEEVPNLRNLEKTVSNSHLPIGWAGYGIGVAYCQNCKRNRE
jgi:hypothetical protein